MTHLRHARRRTHHPEALLVRFEDAPEIQDAVVAEAQKRQEVRMQAANRKRAQTMIEKFGQVT